MKKARWHRRRGAIGLYDWVCIEDGYVRPDLRGKGQESWWF